MDEALQNITAAAWTIAPELGMLAAAALLVLLGSFLPTQIDGTPRRASQIFSMLFAALVLFVPLVLIALDGDLAAAEATDEIVATTFVRDNLAHVIQAASLLAGLVLLVQIHQRLNQRYPAEHAACLLFIIAGVNLVAAANDLIALFISLELISIPTYILMYLSRPDRRALEATVKYFLLSVFSSAFLLYGMSFLVGSAGSTNFLLVRASLAEPTGLVNLGMLQVAMVMVVAGLGFRIASVPFHFYAPDVFQGTTMPSAALLAVVPKIAGFVALVRLVWSILFTDEIARDFAPLEAYGAALFAGLAILTMTVGNVLALLQTDVRRLLAYSSIAHAGYMLIGLAVPGTVAAPNGAQAVLFYLLVYSLMTLGVFGVLLMLQKEGRSICTVRDLNGLATFNPLAAFLLAVFLFGLTGLPPTAGFWGKFNFFVVLWKSGSPALWLLAVGLAINAAIAAWYYLGLIKSAYLDPQTPSVTSLRPAQAPALYGVTAILGVGAVVFFIFPNALWMLLRGIG